MTAGKPEAHREVPINYYTVRLNQGASGWDVQILRPSGAVAFTRSCSSEAEARTFASTVEQHIYWLSPAKFEEYYRLHEVDT
ncbi:MAG TPA: hypothetical protein VHI54_03905 [Actinomycetota bacterium]|nr:hypothetical protein [Actinomycetota bacterium]